MNPDPGGPKTHEDPADSVPDSQHRKAENHYRLPSKATAAVLTAGLVSASPFLIHSRAGRGCSPPNPNILIPSAAQLSASDFTTGLKRWTIFKLNHNKIIIKYNVRTKRQITIDNLKAGRKMRKTSHAEKIVVGKFV
jgi:hypothetical protein